MSKPNRWHALFRRRDAAVALALMLAAAGFAFYAWGAQTNPPGFFIDESSVAYNAHLIAETGRDEHGEELPLYFRAFGDYKNPVYIYLLAAVFRLTGPSIAAARYLSASLGVLAALALGLLGARASGRRSVGLLTVLTALLTPWLFELSRVCVEVAIYPLAVALFLLCLQRATRKPAWSWTDAACVAATLALVTYSYSIGRLLGPLLALGLVLFATTRARLRPLLLTWALYALALVPLVVFNLRHPGALTARFSYLTYITPQSGYTDDAWQFMKHFAGNVNPWPMLVRGDTDTYQIASLAGVPTIAAATFALAAVGAYLAARRARRDAWWRFIFYGLAVSFVPASLTKEYFHVLRLAPVPVFLVALTIPALAWLSEGGRARRGVFVVLIALTVAQGALFRRQYAASAATPQRLHVFDADYPAKLLPSALAASPHAVYIADALARPGYVQALWYATIEGIPRDTFVVLPADAPAPEGSVVITTEDILPRCRAIAESEPYTVCLTAGPPRVSAPLPDTALRADIRVIDAPARMNASGQTKLRVAVRNEGDAVWLARERAGSPFQLSAGNHWLDASGDTVTNDDGRGPLPHDLRPGDEAEISFTINAPPRPGNYLLEVDMLQEGVSWFALKGSKTLRVPVRIE
jgi:4-amino-4-deoxy-L-arabinose transferase-like glycosyltransferase